MAEQALSIEQQLLVGITALTEQVKALTDTVKALSDSTEKRLEAAEGEVVTLKTEVNDLRTQVAVLIAQKPRKVSGWTISAAVVSISTIVLLILDRFYVNQTTP